MTKEHVVFITRTADGLYRVSTRKPLASTLAGAKRIAKVPPSVPCKRVLAGGHHEYRWTAEVSR